MILVLPLDLPAGRLEEVVARIERLGWQAQVSRGNEQIVVGLEGSGDVAQVEAALAGVEVDVIPVRTAAQYRLQRSRRMLLTGLATGLGLLTAAGAGLPVLGFLMPPRGAMNDPDTVSAGTVARLEPGAARTLLVRKRPVLLIRLEEDDYAALSATCTHLDACGLEWDDERRILACPCHGDLFDVHGNVLRGPASIPLQSYAVERIGDELFVRRKG